MSVPAAGDNWRPITRDGLFEVQRRALEEAHRKPGFAYFMEQGLGKTRTVGQEFHELVGVDLVDCLVIVCPKSLRGNWRDEFEEVGYPYPVLTLEDEEKTLAAIAAFHKKRQPFALTFNYELVLGKGNRVLEAMIKMGLRIYIALDESVRIKDYASKNGDRLYLTANGLERFTFGKKKQILKVSAGCAFRRVLSGTPAPQGVHDLWAQFRFLGKMEGHPFFAFRNLYCKMGGFNRKKVVGIKNLDVLKMRTGAFAFRAKKMDWTDLPEKLWAHPREVDLHPDQRRAYLEIMHEFILEIKPDEFITAEMAITVKGKLQQICSGWIYDADKVVHEIVPLEENAKLQDLREFLENIDTKVLVFYYFKPTRGYLERLAEQMGLGYTFLESGLNSAEFERRKKLFNEDDSVQVAFCQTDACKEGLTLLGTKTRPCYTTYFLENTYSLYARAQAEDRNHRHGQYNPVTYHDVVTSREDKAIIKALQKKGELQEALLAEFTAYRNEIT